ncbi:ribokinase [Pseudarthrobacter sp. P1]|uniref:ribokinase n=1 Tax=Pseudarthrobacter sp. P1 TaxID=3418418 RepID=UPI003CEDF542
MNDLDTTTTRTGSAVVLGSINIDNFIYVQAFPEPGETILAQGGTAGLGGKGANQAVAASLFGTTVHFVGQVGRDGGADFVRDRLEGFGIASTLLMTSPDAPTGAAYITVNASGENTIAVVSGANADIDAAQLGETVGRVLAQTTAPATVALAQGETSAAATAAFVRQCHAHGVRVVINLAPAIALPADVLRLADPLIVNEGEARILLDRFAGRGVPLTDPESAAAAAQTLAAMVAASVVITLGPDGAVGADGAGVWHQPSPVPEAVVDTTGAGDAFVGALVSLLAAGASLREAVRWGVAAGSAAVGKRGTTTAYPTRGELATVLANSSGVAL